MAKKIQIPFIHHDGVELMDGYETDCAGLGVLNDKELGTWRLVHISSGLQLGRFRTRKVALRAAELHNEIGTDFSVDSDALKALPDFEIVAQCSVAACAVAIAEDEVLRSEARSKRIEQ